MQKAPNTNSILKQIIKAFPQYGKQCRDYSVKSLAQKLSLGEISVYTTVSEHADLFLWITTKRFTTIPSVLKIIRDEFEMHNYSLLNVDMDCVEAVRKAYNVKSINSNGIKFILSAKDKKVISYADFVDCENGYYDAFNSWASDDRKVPLDYYLNLYPDNSNDNYLEALEDIFNANSRSSQMLYEKNDGQTLHAIGAREGISRERVRKLIERPIVSVTDWVFKYEKALVKRYLASDGTLSEELIKKDISPKNWEVVRDVIIEQSEKLRFIRYDGGLNVIFKDIYKIDKIIEKFASNSYDSFGEYSSDILNAVSVRGYGFLNVSNLEMFLSGRAHLLPSGIQVSRRKTFTNILPVIMLKYFPDGVKIGDVDKMQEIINIAKDKYGIEIDGKDPIRNVAVKIQSKCHLIDKGTYTAIAPPTIPTSLLERVYALILDNNTKFVSYETLYNRLASEFKEYGITNSYAMHGALKCCFDYSDITMSKDYMYVSEGQNSSSAERLGIIKEFLDSAEEPVSIADILDEFKTVDEKELRLLTQYFPQIIKWDETSYCSIDALPIDSSIISILRDSVNALLCNKHSYAGEYALYTYMTDAHSDVMDLLNITTPQQLFLITAWLLKDEFSFSSPHILKDFDGNKFTTDQLIAMFIQNSGKILNKQDLIEEITKLYGRNSSTILLAVNKALSSYVRIDYGEYTTTENLGIKANHLDAVKNFVNSHLQDGAFVVTKDLDVSSLPPVNVKWTPWMLLDVIQTFGLDYATLNLSSSPLTLSIVVYDKEIDIIDIEKRFCRKS